MPPKPWDTHIKITNKLEKVIKGSLGSIPSPLPSVKIQIMGLHKVLRQNSARRYQQTFETKKFVDITQQCNVLPYYLK